MKRLQKCSLARHFHTGLNQTKEARTCPVLLHLVQLKMIQWWWKLRSNKLQRRKTVMSVFVGCVWPGSDSRHRQSQSKRGCDRKNACTGTRNGTPRFCCLTYRHKRFDMSSLQGSAEKNATAATYGHSEERVGPVFSVTKRSSLPSWSTAIRCTKAYSSTELYAHCYRVLKTNCYQLSENLWKFANLCKK